MHPPESAHTFNTSNSFCMLCNAPHLHSALCAVAAFPAQRRNSFWPAPSHPPSAGGIRQAAGSMCCEEDPLLRRAVAPTARNSPSPWPGPRRSSWHSNAQQGLSMGSLEGCEIRTPNHKGQNNKILGVLKVLQVLKV